MKNHFVLILKSASLSAIAFGASIFSSNTAYAQRAENIIYTPEKVKTIPGHGMSKAEYPYDEGGKYRKEWVNTWSKSPVSSSTTVRYPIPLSSKEHSNFAATQRLKSQSSLKRHLEQQKQLALASKNKPEPRKIAKPPATKAVVYNPFKTRINSQPKAKTTPLPPNGRSVSEADLIRSGYIGPYEKMVSRPKPQPIIQKPIQVASKTTTKPAPASPSYHKVKTGDTLFNISKKYGTTVDALKRANGLTSDLIRVGQSLRLALAHHALGIPQKG